MMDPLLLLTYFALPATISLVAFVGLKLHEWSAPPMAADPAMPPPSANHTTVLGSGPDHVVDISIGYGSAVSDVINMSLGYGSAVTGSGTGSLIGRGTVFSANHVVDIGNPWTLYSAAADKPLVESKTGGVNVPTKKAEQES